MKATLLSLILIYLCVGTLSAQSKIKAKWNGETYYTVLPEAYHVSEIKWNPSEEEIPLSAKRAYDIAKEWMEKHFSDDPYFIHSFQLYNFTPKEEKGQRDGVSPIYHVFHLNDYRIQLSTTQRPVRQSKPATSK